MKRSFHNRASRVARVRRRPAVWCGVVSSRERFSRVEHVGRVEGGSSNSSTPTTNSNSSTPPLITMSFDRMGRRVQYLETCGSVTNSNKAFTYDGYLQIANFDFATHNTQLFIWDPTEPIATRPLVFCNFDSTLLFYFHDGAKNVSGLINMEAASFSLELSRITGCTVVAALGACSVKEGTIWQSRVGNEIERRLRKKGASFGFYAIRFLPNGDNEIRHPQGELYDSK